MFINMIQINQLMLYLSVLTFACLSYPRKVYKELVIQTPLVFNQLLKKQKMTIKTKKLSIICNYLTMICKAGIPYLPPFRVKCKFLIIFSLIRPHYLDMRTKVSIMSANNQVKIKGYYIQYSSLVYSPKTQKLHVKGIISSQ